ncbi:MAG: serine/threonine-protein kinase, partial [Polyangiaceae bacterium]
MKSPDASDSALAETIPLDSQESGRIDETRFALSSGSAENPGIRLRLDALGREEGAATRYRRTTLLGSGGMGDVHLCADERIGRDVAMKVIRRMRAENPEMLERFLREARVQGQLEHPAIVPVYDLGVLPDGSTFFTMKRVNGRTLSDVLEAQRSGNSTALEHYSLHRLLADFSRVCLAVHFAHARGVLHRDLKPSNVMLGEFGEVYVLDWGIAKLVTPEESQRPIVD